VKSFLDYFALSAPLFALVGAGYALAALPFWRAAWTALASRLVFNVAMPCLLFHLLSGFSLENGVDARVLLAFFGGCALVFALARLVAARFFALDGVAQSVFGLGAIFSNNVLLGVPLARSTLGPEALPPIALVIVFNAFTLWTLVTVSVEWARHGSLDLAGFGQTAKSVLTNPLVAAILAGALFGAAGLSLPPLVESPLAAIGGAAGPAALLVLGMGLAGYGVRDGLGPSLAIAGLKLFAQPLAVWALGAAVGLSSLELRAVVLLASLSVGANVYLMAAQFQALQGAVATSMVISAAAASVTAPLWIALVSAASP
jgi:malonate transporter